MTTDKARKTAANAVGKLLAEEVGGCFNSEDDTHGECADGDCYCSKRARSIADVSIDAYLSSSTEDGGEAEIREFNDAVKKYCDKTQTTYPKYVVDIDTLLSTTAALRRFVTSLESDLALSQDLMKMTAGTLEDLLKQGGLLDERGLPTNYKADNETLRSRVRELEGRESLRAGHAAASKTFAGVEPDERIIDALQSRVNDLDDQIASYEQWASDVKNLTRQLDVELNGENAARQASLCDLVGSIAPLRQDLEQMRKVLEPFANYADGGAQLLSGDLIITKGSQMAKRQLTLDDCRRARTALTHVPHTGEG